MSRISFALCLVAVVVGGSGGCANFVEKRTIAQFADALEDNNLDKLKLQTSTNFAEKALRRDDALDDFKVLHLPDGKISIEKVEDISEHEKRVTVEVGEKKRRLQYRLVRNEKSGKWVVDDITVKQQRNDVTAAKSVTEQMNLLLSVRDFLSAWKSGKREEILFVVTPELKAPLERLPEKYLSNLTKRVVDGGTADTKKTPNAQLDAEVAVVQLSRFSGEVTLTLKLVDGSWKVSDLAVESRKDGKHIASLAKMATVMKLSLDFLDAYAAADREALAKVCTPKLYNKSLAHADLKAIKLPDAKTVSEKYEVTLDRGSTDFVIEAEKEVIRISFERHDSEDADHPTKYLVEEVTIYELDGTQNKRISSAFTAQAIVQIFGEALARRNLSMLKKISTGNFNERVWQHLDDASLQDMPLKEFQPAPMNIVETSFQGAATEITVDQGVHRMTYVLRDRLGDVRVDDVLVGIPGRPFSLKETLETVLPLARYIQGVRAGELGKLQRISSADFNRLVWTQIDRVPPICELAVKHMQAAVTTVERGEDNALVVLGDDRSGARVLLTKEHGQFVIDEIQLVAGAQPNERVKLKESIRFQMAEGRLRSVSESAALPRTTEAEISLVRPAVATAPLTGQPSAAEPEGRAIQPSDDAFTPPVDSPTPADPPSTVAPQAAEPAAAIQAPRQYERPRSGANVPAVAQ